MSTETAKLNQLARKYNAFRLADIRSVAAREAERDARLRAARLTADDPEADAPGYEIVSAPGCHGEPFPPTVGYVWSREAADDLTSQVTHMPDGSSHHRLELA